MPRAGHRVPIQERIRSNVLVTEAGCWEWQGKVRNGGYGAIEIRAGIGRATRKLRAAHRVSYEAFVAPIPDGLQIDHLCRNRRCVNPAHLEPVTAQENTLRGTSPAAENAAKTTCHRGHELAGDNLRVCADGTRRCRTCIRLMERLAYRKKRAAESAQPGSGARS